MTEQKMRRVWGKKIKLTCKDGDVLEGTVCNFTSSVDNEPEEASISLSMKTKDVEILLNEIESIEVIN